MISSYIDWGAFNGYFEIVKMLCDNNIDILVLNADAKLASQLAYEKGFFDLSVRVLIM